MRRKGWHRKKRRLRHDYKVQIMGTMRNIYRRYFGRIFSQIESSPMAVVTCSRRSGKTAMMRALVEKAARLVESMELASRPVILVGEVGTSGPGPTTDNEGTEHLRVSSIGPHK